MPDFEPTFRVLKALLAPYAPHLHATIDTPTHYELGGYVEQFKRSMMFAGIQIRRSHVSFHLMPVYSHPELLGKISDQLRRRMQGKASFHFIRPDAELFAELSAIVDAGFELYGRLGWVKV